MNFHKALDAALLPGIVICAGNAFKGQVARKTGIGWHLGDANDNCINVFDAQNLIRSLLSLLD